MNERQGNDEEVRGVVIPAGEADILLPNAAVAEVLAYQAATPFASGPPWLLGAVTWHDRPVPLISLSAAGADGMVSEPGPRARLVICYTPNGNVDLPYVGLLAVAPPRLARFKAQELEPSPSPPDNPLVLHALTYASRNAWIPDMDALERAALEALAP